jgi:hypothetical protein
MRSSNVPHFWQCSDLGQILSNNFQPKVECGEARSGSVAAEGRWVVPNKFQRRPSFSVANPQMLKKYRFRAAFILSDNHVVYTDD